MNYDFPQSTQPLIRKKMSKSLKILYLSINFIFEIPAAFYSLHYITNQRGINSLLFESYVFSIIYLFHFTFRENIIRRIKNSNKKHTLVILISFFVNIFISYELFEIFFINKYFDIQEDSKLFLLYSISLTQSILITADIIIRFINIV